MKRRYFCQSMHEDSLVVRGSANRDGSRLIFATKQAGGEGRDIYLNPTQVRNLIELLQIWVHNQSEVKPLWENL